MENIIDAEDDCIEEPTDEEIIETILNIIMQTKFNVENIAAEFFYDFDYIKERLEDLVSKGLLEENFEDYSEGYNINWNLYEIKKIKDEKKSD